MSNDLIPPTPSDETYAVDEDQGDVFTHADPFDLFSDWLALARLTEPNDANAMAIATVDEAGLPDVRMVLLKDISENGLTFHTSRLSAKGRQLLTSGKAALCFHWKTIRRQVRFRGAAVEVSQAESANYFATRARGARIGAWASKQSQEMSDPDEMKRAFAELEKKFAKEDDVPKPEYWSGFRIIPTEMEFWVNRPYRMHDRLLFKRGDANANWNATRLYP
ncbi:MAG: pyridoxamine 5'-phosphate oxidase [Marinicaulis sp.]|nr:pyridoxamine 5'-phosphate oxidase [Marinicaulis sp.]